MLSKVRDLLSAAGADSWSRVIEAELVVSANPDANTERASIS